VESSDENDLLLDFWLRDSKEAEFLAIVFALKLSLDREWLRKRDIIVESDSQNALARVHRKDSCPWNFRFFMA
jgi:ribonuclease HI